MHHFPHKSNLPHNQSSFFTSAKYWDAVERFLQTELINDGEDYTSQFFIEKSQTQSAFITAKSSGILSGKDEVEFLFQHFFPDIAYKWNNIATDNTIQAGEKILHCQGKTHSLMKFERLVLNILSRMSGIATGTAHIAAISPLPIAATRKTQWSYLDKKAVYEGGGLSHRMGLFDGMMLKENHLISMQYDLKNFEKKLSTLFTHSSKNIFSKNIQFLEIEVETPQEYKNILDIFLQKNAKKNEVLKAFPKVIMFDNFSPQLIQKTLQNENPQIRLENNIFLEISGGITKKNIQDYSNCPADLISLGSLTNASDPLDFSLRVEAL